MVWSDFWGYWNWLYKHASARAYYYQVLTEEESVQIEMFEVSNCQLLGCPGCRYHAMKYIIDHKPKFTTGKEYWKYEFDFHNAVNQTKQNPSMVLTMEEAEESFKNRMMDRGVGIDEMEKTFLFQDFWNVLLFACTYFTITPDAPKEMEQDILKRFLFSACYTLPFNRYICNDNRMARYHLIDFLQTNMNVSTQEKAMITVTNMYNVLALEFNQPIRTYAENKAIFDLHANDGKNYPLFVRAQEVHAEDQLKLIALQKELHGKLHEKKNNDTINTVTNDTYWQNVSIALSIVLGFVLLLNLLYLVKMVWKFKWKFNKHIENHTNVNGSSSV